MKMAAAGTRGELVGGGARDFGLAVKADALWVGTAFEGVDGPAGRLAATAELGHFVLHEGIETRPFTVESLSPHRVLACSLPDPPLTVISRPVGASSPVGTAATLPCSASASTALNVPSIRIAVHGRSRLRAQIPRDRTPPLHDVRANARRFSATYRRHPFPGARTSPAGADECPPMGNSAPGSPQPGKCDPTSSLAAPSTRIRDRAFRSCALWHRAARPEPHVAVRTQPPQSRPLPFSGPPT